MSTLTNPWWRVAAVATAGVLSIPAWAAPAVAAPPDGSAVAEALRVRAAVTKVLRGERPGGSVTGVDDGYPGGIWIAAGGSFSCSAGMMLTYCWGAGDDGRLGTGDTADALDPAEVDGPADFEEDAIGAVAAGQGHTCALTWFDDSDDGGTLFCWGDNGDGQVGDGSTTSRSEPVEVADDIRQVAPGAHHTCAITEDAGVSCWGRNDKGQLGSGSTGAPVPAPQAVPGLADVIDLAAGGDTTCALTEDGDAWCWGPDDDGQLGDGGGAGSGSASPVAVVMTGVDGGFAQIEAGDRHVCGVTEVGVVWCWGDDASGQLGNGSAADDPSQPIAVGSDEDFLSVSAGADSTCAVAYSGAVWCWGDNARGQLGTGDRTDADEPAEVDHANVPSSPLLESLGTNGARAAAGGGILTDVSVGEAHACALDLLGNTFCWGDNSRGQIGDGTTGDALVPVATSLVPDAATRVRVTPGDARLTVSWTPPADLGSSPLVGSAALAIEEDESFGSACKGEPDGCEITDLTNGTEYLVVVITQTEGGASLSALAAGTPVGRASPPPAPGGGGGELPITGAAVSMVIAAGGALVAGGLLCLRLVRRRPS